MKNIKNVLAMLLALSMVLCLCACGKESNTTTSTTTQSPKTEPQGTEPQQSEPENNVDDTTEPVEYVYTVSVVDTDGNPIAGVPVQICAGATCVPKVTDENGVAGYDAEITGDDELTAKIIKVPEGYTADVTEIVMEGDSVEFVLQSDSADTDLAVYTVSVHDGNGQPIEGVFVQICAGSTCVPKSTNADGIAVYTEEITGDGELVAKVISAPEGYIIPEDNEIPMADGAVDVGFTLIQSEPEYRYTVQVITTEDSGVEGVFVQLCAGSTCVPKQTDEHGMAGYEEEITGDGQLTAKLISIPEGYELADGEEAEIILDEGATDAIFVLQEKN